jgi:Na+-transporting NADH:ubiquinone oxidoreductase subunit NqrA
MRPNSIVHYGYKRVNGKAVERLSLCTFLPDGKVEMLPISRKVAERLIKRGMSSGS